MGRLTTASAGLPIRGMPGKRGYKAHCRDCGVSKENKYWREIEHGSPPRLRGFLYLLSMHEQMAGSPPRLRGFLAFSACRCNSLWLTAASAGFPPPAGWTSGAAPAHRRVRGASTSVPMPCAPLYGSPPRLRGFLGRVRGGHSPLWLTAASAGFPRARPEPDC